MAVEKLAEQPSPAPVDSYRNRVEQQATAADGSMILNRSPEHASVLVEWIFRTSSTLVEILTAELSVEVYGKDALILAALEFLRRPLSRINILAEQPVDRSSHPFFVACDTAGFSDQISLGIVSSEKQKQYSFNFAVGDSRHYRFERSRETYEAVAHFGEEKTAKKLHEIFADLQS